MKKIVIGFVLAAAVAFAGYTYYKKDNGVPHYRTSKVEKGEIVDAITAADQGAGVVVLMDLGSAVLSAEIGRAHV